MTGVTTSAGTAADPPLAAGRLRVAAFLQGFRPVVGGAQIQFERLLPHLEAREAEIEVVTRTHSRAPRREAIPGGSVRRTLVGGTSPLASADYILESAAYLTLHRREIDLVHAHGALSEGAAALWGTVLGIPALVKVLRTGPEGDLRALERRPAGGERLRLLAKRAWFVAVSREARAEIESQGVPAERIFDIPNGVDTRTFHPADAGFKTRLRARLRLPSEPLIVCVGRLEAVKRFDILVRGMSNARSAHLLMVGEGPERGVLESLARELGVGDRIRFVGKRGNVADYLRAADVFATTSNAEGLSNALLEAMAVGLACVAAPASAVDELLAEERGVVVNSDNPATWGSQLEALLADEERVMRLGRRAADYVASIMTLERTAERIMAAYRHIVACSHRHGLAR